MDGELEGSDSEGEKFRRERRALDIFSEEKRALAADETPEMSISAHRFKAQAT
jgi:hypothetical protein